MLRIIRQSIDTPPKQLRHPPTNQIPQPQQQRNLFLRQVTRKQEGICEQVETLLYCPRKISGECRAKPCRSVEIDWGVYTKRDR